MESRLDGRLACETDWRSRKVERSRRIWNFLQSNRAACARTVQRRTAIRWQHVSFKHAVQHSLCVSGRRTGSQSIHGGYQPDSTNAVRSGGIHNWPEWMRGLVHLPPTFALRRISAAPQGPIFGAIQSDDRAPVNQGHVAAGLLCGNAGASFACISRPERRQYSDVSRNRSNCRERSLRQQCTFCSGRKPREHLWTFGADSEYYISPGVTILR